MEQGDRAVAGGGDDEGVELAELQHQPAAVGGDCSHSAIAARRLARSAAGASFSGERGGRALDG